MRIGIGIDTGGTCTDAVALDLDTQELLAKGKSLTTREDLSVGIGKALDMLPEELVRRASIVSLSTTLATNACIEDKGCRAKLLIFGLTEENINRVNASETFSLKSDSVLCFDTHGSADGLMIDEPDWEDFYAQYGDWLRDADALSAVELYANYNGAPAEKHFKELVGERIGCKCVCASELTSGLSVLGRGSTALLNARLFPIVKEFVDAAMADFRARGCKAPIMVVRSDGSLMSSDYTLSRPVETILSGPAASVLAGKGFSNDPNYIIVDMGGTSTDVSVVSDGKPVTADGGIQIAQWPTYVRGIQVSPFNLGGDSAIRLVKGKLELFPRRVKSLCSAASQWPEIKTQLERLLRTNHYNEFPLHEFFYLIREPEDISHYNDEEKRLIDHVRSGPKILERLYDEADIDLYHLNSERLEAEGVVMRCGMTPTDFMHIRGEYNEYDREASVMGAKYMLKSLDRVATDSQVRLLAEEAYSLVEGRMYENLLQIALERQYPQQFESGVDEQTLFLIRNAWENRNNGSGKLLQYGFGTAYTLIGIGAPTHLFLPEVAKALGANYILPDNAEVANAIGALKADINAVVRVNISQRFNFEEGKSFYIVHAPTGSRRFEDKDEAGKFAMAAAESAALAEARYRGAKGDLHAKTHLIKHSAISKWGTDVDMGYSAVSEVEVNLE